jgi:large subunit ribosomal protein L17
VTLAKRDDLHSRRLAIAFLHQKETVKKLFAEVAPASKDRQGGYCRITKLGARMSDSAPMAVIEWVDRAAKAEEPAAEAPTETAAAAE